MDFGFCHTIVGKGPLRKLATTRFRCSFSLRISRDQGKRSQLSSTSKTRKFFISEKTEKNRGKLRFTGDDCMPGAPISRNSSMFGLSSRKRDNLFILTRPVKATDLCASASLTSSLNAFDTRATKGEKQILSRQKCEDLQQDFGRKLSDVERWFGQAGHQYYKTFLPILRVTQLMANTK